MDAAQHSFGKLRLAPSMQNKKFPAGGGQLLPASWRWTQGERWHRWPGGKRARPWHCLVQRGWRRGPPLRHRGTPPESPQFLRCCAAPTLLALLLTLRTRLLVSHEVMTMTVHSIKTKACHCAVLFKTSKARISQKHEIVVTSCTGMPCDIVASETATNICYIRFYELTHPLLKPTRTFFG